MLATTRDDEWTAERKALLKQTIAKDATDAELELFIVQCKRTGLDPFTRQIYFLKRKAKRWDPTTRQETWEDQVTIVVSIDGFRVIAQRSGEYAGQLGPFWCGEDGVWRDVWLGRGAPAACKVGILRRGFAEPLWAVTRVSEYSTGKGMWEKMPSNQSAKCTEALGLRKAFPNDLSGLYAPEEMDQALVQAPPPVLQPDNPRPNVYADPETTESVFASLMSEVEAAPDLAELLAIKQSYQQMRPLKMWPHKAQEFQERLTARIQDFRQNELTARLDEFKAAPEPEPPKPKRERKKAAYGKMDPDTGEIVAPPPDAKPEREHIDGKTAMERIEAATNLDELHAVGEAIAQSETLTEDDRILLRGAYADRKGFFEAGF